MSEASAAGAKHRPLGGRSPDIPEATVGRGIADAFAPPGRRAALMPYMMGGFPDLAASLEVGRAYVEAGADLVEIGIPFSDPLADGPAIQLAGYEALAAGATFERVLAEVAAPLAADVPVVAMCYTNLLMAHGLGESPQMLRAHGVSGLIVPDLPAAEAGELRAACDDAEIALIPLVAPTTPPDEVERIARAARGFVYVVSVTGVTGERAALPPELGEVVERVRAAAAVPVAVGFGVGTPEQVAEVGRIADGVIVGSRLVRALSGAPSLEAGLEDVRSFLAESVAALRSG
jgi:tryptophan synthase alpha chain